MMGEMSETHSKLETVVAKQCEDIDNTTSKESKIWGSGNARFGRQIRKTANLS